MVKQTVPQDVPLGTILADNPLAVRGIVIDRTAANPVVAREEAIAAARRAAFRTLAKAGLSPAAYAALKMPPDNDLSLMVQDFEIENEQMSSTRYIGTFTVRFNASARTYIDGAPPVAVEAQGSDALGQSGLSTGLPPHLNVDQAQQHVIPPAPVLQAPPPAQADGHGIVWDASPQTQTQMVQQAQVPQTPSRDNPQAAVAAGISILVLPYYENISGQTLLWEEPNPWLHMWQSVAPQAQDGTQYIVPLGDIDDMAAGSSGAVWKGDYKTIENLRRHYNASAVALAVANKSGPDFTIDMYYYTQDSLRRRMTLTPYVQAGATDEEAFRAGVTAVLQALKPQENSKRPALVMTQERPVSAPPPQTPYVLKPQTQLPPRVQATVSSVPAVVPVAVSAPAAVAGETHVAAQMNFSNFGAWMDVQRRVAAISPSIKLSIDAISSNSAQFTLGYAGTLPALTDALAGQGLVLSAPARTATGTLVYALTEAH